MPSTHDPTRRSITVAAALAMLGYPIITLSGCGGGGGGTPTGPNPSPTPTPGPGDVSGVISANHGHSVAITAAQLQAANAVQLTLLGGGHEHSVQLSASEVVQIRDRQRVSKDSSDTQAHNHTVTFN